MILVWTPSVTPPWASDVGITIQFNSKMSEIRNVEAVSDKFRTCKSGNAYVITLIT